jgi:hypothetical protein
MSRLHPAGFLLLVVTALAPPAARAAYRVALLPATGANVHEGHLAAATDVLRSQLERTGRFEVVLVPGAADGAEPTSAEAAAAARAVEASLGVTLRISRLGESATLRLAAYGPDGKQVHVDELAAGSPDDMEPVLRRLALGLSEGKPARVLAEIDSVTEREADPYLKYAATQVFGVRLGTTWFLDSADASSEAAEVSGGGIFWLYDARHFLADLSFDILAGDGRRLFGLGLGFYYPLSKGNLAPYVGGGLGYHWTDTGGAGASGLALRAAAGVILGRLSTVQVRVEAGYHVSLYEESPDTDWTGTPQPGTSARANGPMLTVGLGF